MDNELKYHIAFQALEQNIHEQIVFQDIARYRFG